MIGKLQSPVRRLGILTGGGDVPGLNAAIKAVVYRAEPERIQVIGIRAGWEGLTFLNRDLSVEDQTFNSDDPSTWERGYIRPLTRLRTRNIDRLTDMPTSEMESRRVDPRDYNANRYRPNFERIQAEYIPYLPTDAI